MQEFSICTNCLYCALLILFQILGKITSEGVFLEQLETDPDKYLPEIDTKELGGEVVKVTVILWKHFHTEVSPTLHLILYELCLEKACLWGFRPGLTQIGLYSH